MTDHEIIERLAREICDQERKDPDHFLSDLGPMGPYGAPRPWFAPDGVQRPWHRYVEEATALLHARRMQHLLKELDP